MKIYAIRDIKTDKILTGLTNKSRRFWESKYWAEQAIKTTRRNLDVKNLRIVEFELEEICEYYVG